MHEVKTVVTSCHFDNNIKFCAIVTEVKDSEL